MRPKKRGRSIEGIRRSRTSSPPRSFIPTQCRKNGTDILSYPWHHPARRTGYEIMFIVQGKPREPAEIIKAVKDTRTGALATANDFLAQGMPFVTVIADGRVYTADEFALTLQNGEASKDG